METGILMFLPCFGFWLGASIAVAAVSRTPRGSRAGFLLTLFLLPMPFFVQVSPLPRLLLAAAVIWLVLRSADLAVKPMHSSFFWRWAHLVLLPDIRLANRSNIRVDARAAVRTMLFLAVGSGLAVVFASITLRSGWRLALLWCLVALSVVVAYELVVALISFLSALSGVSLPPINDAPLKSRSVGEFWSKRWNRVMSRMLHDLFYQRFARRSTTLALSMSFFASAAIHAYAMAAAVGAAAALSWAVFFSIQPIVISIERYLGVKRWPITMGRIWTVCVLTLLLPLFAQPMVYLADL